MQQNVSERRVYARIQQGFTVKLQELDLYQELRLAGRKKETAAMIVNLSASGALVSTGQFFKEKTILKLEVDMPEWQKHTGSFFRHAVVLPSPPMLLTAEVVRSQRSNGGNHSVAVRFVGVDRMYTRTINNMVKEFERRKALKKS